MKIPYFNKKIENAFNLYCDDFCENIAKSINIHQDDPNNRLLFRYTYSLFVLIESLKNSDYYFDPTKEILLQEALETGRKDIAEETARRLSVRDLSDCDKLIKTGMSKQRFTPYLKELYSDTLMLLNGFYSNNYRSCYISLRCMLEDLYRHLYYKDHVQEYWAITRKQNDYDEYGLGLKPEFFRDYIKRISHFEALKDFKCKGDSSPFEINEHLYKITSAYLHGSRFDALSCFESNSTLVFDRDSAENTCKSAKDGITLSVIFLISAHKEYFLRFNDYIKSIVFEIFDNNVKYDFRKCLNV